MPNLIEHKKKVFSHLIEDITASTLYLPIDIANYGDALGGTGDLYLILRGPTSREIVKVDQAASKWGEYLKVERGQGGTLAIAWPMGTVLFASTNAEAYNAYIQSEDARTIDYNPNEILTPLYAGEKVYQNSPGGCERWWKSYDGINPYWDIITGLPCGQEIYEDIGFTYDLLVPGTETPLVLTTGYIAGVDNNINTARQVAVAYDVSASQVSAAFYQLGSWRFYRTWLIIDLSTYSGPITSAVLSLWTGSNTVGWGSYGLVMVQGKTGWKDEGGGGGNMADNYATWYWPGPGAETYWETTYLSNIVNPGTGSAQDVQCDFTLNAAGLAVLNAKIGTANWLELVLLTKRDVDSQFSDTANVWFWNENYSNPDYYPVLNMS